MYFHRPHLALKLGTTSLVDKGTETISHVRYEITLARDLVDHLYHCLEWMTTEVVCKVHIFRKNTDEY